MLDRPVKARTFSGLARRRRLVNSLATVLVTLSMLVALTPLIRVLGSVIAKGFKAVTSSAWWTHSQAGMTAFVAGAAPITRSSAPCCRAWCVRRCPFRSALWWRSTWSNTIVAG
ncbi:phosphate-transport integral membrane ABC transporter, PstA domain protein [Mycobacterium ulcerans str. Harvey]|uniref:Phosphate-transport integral membrane ABC transporter, PstA domain protein n=1 Tax=Mycobacterium ulcerans str. Harvey TaxID=1299332 RepID=A0ABN0R6S0_MYCUL|nr:phosphate-transport integral membrane ABC transporter, PstA domain protein [Mycobacterium ulcerans str. Harvey]